MHNERFIKLIVTGHVVEVYTYEKMPVPSARKGESSEEHDRLEKTEDEWLEDKRGDKKQNARRGRWNLIRLVNANFNENSKFVTLTFADNITDLDQAHVEFDKFMKRLRRKYGQFKYIAVVEFQKRGAVHYHFVSDLPYIPKDELAAIWRNGFVRINKIEHVDNVGAYISKYMSKAEPDIRLRQRKNYFTSQNLDRPVIVRGDLADPLVQMWDLEHKKEVYTDSYISEHHGKITYKQFNLKRED